MLLLISQTLSSSTTLAVRQIGKAKPVTEEVAAKAAEKSSKADFTARLFREHTPKQKLQLSSKQRDSQSPIYKTLLHECTREGSLEGALQVHAHLIKRGLECDYSLQSRLLSLYTKCEDFPDARMVFDTSPAGAHCRLISWNSMITMYSRAGLVDEAMSLFLDMQNQWFQPDQFTLSVVIGDARRQSQLPLGRQLHSLAIKLGYGEEEFVGSSLIQMYVACERIDDSLRVFEGVSQTRSPAVWNSMIARLVDSGLHEDGLRLYPRMLQNGIEPTALTFGSLLKACADLDAIVIGEQVHSQVIIRGFSCNTILETALVDLYVKCRGGGLEDGRCIFDRMEERNVITWNCLIRGYSQMGNIYEALELFCRMRREEIVPDKFTFPALLTGAVTESHCPRELKCLHASVIKVGLETDPFIGACLISLYSKSRAIDDARLALDDTDSVDLAVWSSMISSKTKKGEGEEALRIFTDMLHLDIRPDQFIYSILFTACSDESALEMGKQIHAHRLKVCETVDVAVENSLVTMYSNCGCITEAWRTFDSLADPNVISFNSMISALGLHGLPKDALELYAKMKLHGTTPDAVTLLNLLSAFNHAGLVDQGLELFSCMEDKEGVTPGYQHYACVVDMLARAGDIEEAMRWIDEMPFDPEPSLWRVMLGACGKHRNLAIGRPVGELLLELDPYDASNYTFLANIYARSGLWSEADRLRQAMGERGIQRQAAVSWIEIHRRSHTFRAEDRSHPQTEDIYNRLRELIKDIAAKGYVPDISYTLHDIEDDRRRESLYYHSEKLAFAFGTLSAAPGTTLRIMKNLRVCGDCHSAFKYFSLITGRKVVLRDTCRFHHFSGGLCSCHDYW